MSDELFRSLIRRIEALEKQLNKTSVTESSGSGGSGAPVGAKYVTLATDGTLTQERVLTAGANVTLTDDGAGSTLTVAAPLNGAVSTVTNSNLTPSRAVVSDGSGKIATAIVTTTELNYVAGLTSAAQTQLNTKALASRLISTAAGSGLANGGDLSADRALALDISNLTIESTPDNADYVAVYDTSAGAMRRQSRNNFLSGTGASAASETAAGIIEIADQTEANTGQDDTRALTPLKLFAHAWPTVSITGATTLTSSAFSKIHICTGTSADYTVTLPAVSGNAGRWIAFVMSNALTKLVTLDGNGSETINGELTRVMWANEWVLLYCDGTMWYKQAGLTIPMMCVLTNDANQTGLTTSSWTKLNFNSKPTDIGGMGDTTNMRCNIRRGNNYAISGTARPLTMAIDRFIIAVCTDLAGTGVAVQELSSTATNLANPSPNSVASLGTGATIYLLCYHNRGSDATVSANSGFKTRLAITERPSW